MKSAHLTHGYQTLSEAVRMCRSFLSYVNYPRTFPDFSILSTFFPSYFIFINTIYAYAIYRKISTSSVYYFSSYS